MPRGVAVIGRHLGAECTRSVNLERDFCTLLCKVFLFCLLHPLKRRNENANVFGNVFPLVWDGL